MANWVAINHASDALFKSVRPARASRGLLATARHGTAMARRSSVQERSSLKRVWVAGTVADHAHAAGHERRAGGTCAPEPAGETALPECQRELGCGHHRTSVSGRHLDCGASIRGTLAPLRRPT
jgi:hypothetical protein